MSTARPTLAAEHREVTGKAVARLRKTGKLPAVVYGHGVDSSNVTVDAHDFELLRRHIGQRVVGTDLPEHQVGLDQRDLVLDARRSLRGEFAGYAAVDHHDVEALDGLAENLSRLPGIAAVQCATARRR